MERTLFSSDRDLCTSRKCYRCRRELFSGNVSQVQSTDRHQSERDLRCLAAATIAIFVGRIAGPDCSLASGLGLSQPRFVLDRVVQLPDRSGLTYIFSHSLRNRRKNRVDTLPLLCPSWFWDYTQIQNLNFVPPSEIISNPITVLVQREPEIERYIFSVVYECSDKNRYLNINC